MRADTPDTLRTILESVRTVAVIGVSTDPTKDSHTVPIYLKEHGYEVFAVNPRVAEVLGSDAYASLKDIPVAIDVVDVFRPQDEGADIAREAIAKGAKVLWFQEGTGSEEGATLAEEAGLTVVMDMCMRATHRALRIGEQD